MRMLFKKLLLLMSNISKHLLPHLILIAAPKASICSDIWKANSRVGVRIKPNKRWGFSKRAWRIGIANAPVFPDPVSAKPMISFPEQKKEIYIYFWKENNVIYLLYYRNV